MKMKRSCKGAALTHKKNPTIIHIVFTSIDREKPCKGDTFQSPGRKPWVNCSQHIFELRRSGTFPANAKPRTATTPTKRSLC